MDRMKECPENGYVSWLLNHRNKALEDMASDLQNKLTAIRKEQEEIKRAIEGRT